MSVQDPTKLFEYPLKEICFGHIFIHLTIKDLFHLRNVCRKSLQSINEYFDRMEHVNVSSRDFQKPFHSWLNFFILLKDNKSICDLNLSKCRWIDEDGFIQMVQQQNRLKSINLSSTFHITNRSLITMAMSCTTLETINLENCGWLCPETLSTIVDNCHQLINLNLASCWNLNDESIKNLLEKRGKSIKNLVLSKIYSLTDETMKSIQISAITLTNLDISYCWKITDSGIRHLCQCENLRQINLNGCTGITKLGYKYLSKESDLEIVQ